MSTVTDAGRVPVNWSASPPPARPTATEAAAGPPTPPSAAEPVDKFTPTTPAATQTTKTDAKHEDQDAPAPRVDKRADPATIRRRTPVKRDDLKVKDLKRREYRLPAARMDTAEMVRLFGPDGARLKEMSKDRPDITIGNLLKLKRVGIDQVYEATKLLTQRPDLKLNDIIDQAGAGQALLKPATYHNEGQQILRQSRDVRPDELANMGDQFRHTYGTEAGRAFGKAADLLSYRSDLNSATLEAQARDVPAGRLDGAAAWKYMQEKYRDGHYTNYAHNLTA